MIIGDRNPPSSARTTGRHGATNGQRSNLDGGDDLYHLVHPGVHSSVKFFLNMLPIAHSVLGLQGQHKSVTF